MNNKISEMMIENKGDNETDETALLNLARKNRCNACFRRENIGLGVCASKTV